MHALDPKLQVAHDNEQSMYSFQATQIFALNNQVCDQQALLETLHNCLSDVEHERHAAEHQADRAELMLMRLVKPGSSRSLKHQCRQISSIEMAEVPLFGLDLPSLTMLETVRGRPFDTRFLSAQTRTPRATSQTFATHVNDRTTAKPSGGGS
jgi:hypothetical protein